jgi:hypothetical protein
MFRANSWTTRPNGSSIVSDIKHSADTRLRILVSGSSMLRKGVVALGGRLEAIRRLVELGLKAKK